MYEVIIMMLDFPSENVRSTTKATLHMSRGVTLVSACDVLISLISFNNK